MWFSHPGGDWPALDLRGVAVGLLICRDKSFPEAARILALEGAELLLAPHSSTQWPFILSQILRISLGSDSKEGAV